MLVLVLEFDPVISLGLGVLRLGLTVLRVQVNLIRKVGNRVLYTGSAVYRECTRTLWDAPNVRPPSKHPVNLEV